MSEPDLLLLNSCGGDWELYLDVVHEAFLDDVDRTWLMYKERRITSPKQPESLGRGVGFWHVISEGKTEEDRVPDIRRCERICWIRYVVENAHTHPHIDVWQNMRGTTTNILFWFNENTWSSSPTEKLTGFLKLRTAHFKRGARSLYAPSAIGILIKKIAEIAGTTSMLLPHMADETINRYAVRRQTSTQFLVRSPFPWFFR